MNRSALKRSAFSSFKCCIGFGILYPTSKQIFSDTRDNCEYGKRAYHRENTTNYGTQSTCKGASASSVKVALFSCKCFEPMYFKTNFPTPEKV